MKMSRKFKNISTCTLIIYIAQMFHPIVSTSGPFITGSGSGTPYSGKKGVDCTAFCNRFTGDGDLSSDTWNSVPNIDVLCNQYGYTDAFPSSSLPDPVPVPKFTPPNIVDLCAYHNSQAENYCRTKIMTDGTNEANSGAKPKEMALLGMDLVVLGTCAAACISGPAIGAVLNAACSVGAVGESIAEMAMVKKLNDSETSKVITNLAGALGIAGGVGTGIQAVHNSGKKGSSGKGDYSFLDDADDLPVDGDGKDKAGKALKEAEKKADTFADKAKSNAKKNSAACFTAATMALLAGVRAYNISQLTAISDDSCDQISKLSTGSQGNGISGSNGSGAPPPPAGSSSTDSGSSGAGTFSAQNAVNKYQQCMSGGTPNVCSTGDSGCCASANIAAQGSSATEGNLLSSSGLPALLSQAPANLDGLVGQALNDGVGSAIASMGGAGVPSGLMNALGQIADSAKKEAASISGALGITPFAVTSYKQGGGGKKSDGNDSSNPFSAFLNSSAQKGNLKATDKDVNFQKSSDIWHSNAVDNIFQIGMNVLWKIRLDDETK